METQLCALPFVTRCTCTCRWELQRCNFAGCFICLGFYVLKHCLVCLLHDSCSCIMSSVTTSAFAMPLFAGDETSLIMPSRFRNAPAPSSDTAAIIYVLSGSIPMWYMQIQLQQSSVMQMTLLRAFLWFASFWSAIQQGLSSDHQAIQASLQDRLQDQGVVLLYSVKRLLSNTDQE